MLMVSAFISCTFLRLPLRNLHQSGETTARFKVTILNDSLNDDGETVKVEIKSAVWGNSKYSFSQGRTASIDISQIPAENLKATGTITNTGPIPRAWLTRFGRTAAEHVSDAIGERVQGAPHPRLVVSGQSLLADGGSSLPWVESVRGGFDDDSRHGGAEPRGFRGLTARELLLTSSFHLASAADPAAGARWSVWGRAAGSSFKGREDALTIEGDVTTATLGVDLERGRWLLGLALSRSAGEGSFKADDAGELESTLTGAHPYARYAVSERLSLWGALGYAAGELTLDIGDAPHDTDLEMKMAALGARGVLLPASVGNGFELAIRADLLASETASDATPNLSKTDSETSRLRLLLEGKREISLGSGSLTPSVELGLRYDGGDAETGLGAESGGAIRYTNSRFAVEVRARGLVAHGQNAYKEWGVSGSVAIDPGQRGRGLSMRLGSARGAFSRGAKHLWSRHAAAALAHGDGSRPGARLDAEAGYGLETMGALLTPYGGLTLHEKGAKSVRVGLRLGLGKRKTLSLEGSRRWSGEKPVHAVMLNASLRW